MQALCPGHTYRKIPRGKTMFTLFLRSILVYGFLILTMRILGKRQMGQLQPYEFALTLLLAEIIADPVSNVSTPLLHGLIPVAAVIVAQGAISILCMKSDRFRALISGRPTVVIRRGIVDRKALGELCLSLSELLEGLRSAGFADIADVGSAIVEANGGISAFPSAESRQPTTEEMHITPGYEGVPLILIMDGCIQRRNLLQTGRDEAWLRSLLGQRGLGEGAVYLSSLDTHGQMLLQLMDGSVQQFSALQEDEVSW